MVQLTIVIVVSAALSAAVVLNPVRHSLLILGLLLACGAFLKPSYGLLAMLAAPTFIYLGKRLEFYLLLDPSSEYNNPVSLIPEVLLGILVVSVLVRAPLRRRLRDSRSTLMWSVVALVLLSTLQVFNPNSSLKVGLFGFRTFGFYIMAFFVSNALAQTEADVQRLIRFTVLLAAAVALYGIFQQFAFVPPWDQAWFLEFLSKRTFSWLAGYRFSWEELRKFSTMQHPPAAANLYLFAILLAAPSLFRIGTNLWLLNLVMLPSIGLGLFFTFVRGGWVGTLVGLVAMVSLAKVPRARRRRASILLYTVAILVTLGVLFLWAPRLANSQFVQRFSPGVERRLSSLARPMESPEMQVRFNYWDEALGEARRSPVGLGIGTTGGVAQRIEGFGVVDNLYLKVLLELGWAGIVIFSVILSLSTYTAWQLYRRVPGRIVRDFGLSALCIVLAIAFEGIVQPTLEMSVAAIYFWSILGVVNSLSHATARK